MPEVRAFCPLITKDPKQPVKCNTECAWYADNKCALISISEGVRQSNQLSKAFQNNQKSHSLF